MKKSTWVIVAVVGLAMGLSWCGLTKVWADDKRVCEDAIFRVVGVTIENVHYQTLNAWEGLQNRTKEFMAVAIANPETGVSSIIYAQMNNEKMLKALKPGDYLMVTVYDEGLYHKPVARSIAQYNPKPGEEQPNTYFFVSSAVEKVKNTDLLGVTASRFNVKSVFYVRPVHDKDNLVIPEPKMAKFISSLKADDRLEIIVNKSEPPILIKSIFKSPLPFTGAFVEMRKKTLGAREYDAVAVKGEKDVATYVVPADIVNDKLVSDANVIKAASRMAKDANVVCRLFEDEGTVFLRGIDAVKK